MAKKQKSANRKKNIAKADASSDIRSKANRVARQRKERKFQGIFQRSKTGNEESRMAHKK